MHTQWDIGCHTKNFFLRIFLIFFFNKEAETGADAETNTDVKFKIFLNLTSVFYRVTIFKIKL